MYTDPKTGTGGYSLICVNEKNIYTCCTLTAIKFIMSAEVTESEFFYTVYFQ